jgi:undecaprenyl-diphosphatase
VKIGPLIFAALVAAWVANRFRRLSNEGRVIGIALAAGLAVYGSGVVHLPNLERVILDIGNTLGPYTYAFVGVMAFLETGFFVGLIAPGEFTILLGGVIAGQGRIDVVALIAIVWVAAVAGDVTSYVLGRRLGRGFLIRHGERVKITPERVEQVERFFNRYGGWTILIGRFVGLVRAIAPFLAGASRMRFRRFLPFDIVGAGLWGTTFVLLGYIFWQSFNQVVDLAKRGAFALGAVIVTVVGAIAAYRHFRVPENRAAARAALERERRPLLRPLARAALALHDRALAPAGRRLVRPARFVRDRLTPGELGLEFTTLLALAFVGCFVFVAIAVRVHEMHSMPVDREALRLADRLHEKAVVDVVKVVTNLGATAVVGAAVLATTAFLAASRRMLEGATLVLASLLTFTGVQVAKAAEGRPRPSGGLVDAVGSSFPSAHAAYAVAWVGIAVALSRSVPRLTGRAAVVGAAIALAAVVGLSRVYLRVHYLSDVVAGWSLGVTIFSLCGVTALVVGQLRQNQTS